MQDSEIKKGGGKRTDADRDTAFRLGTGTGPGRVSDRPVKSQNEQGRGSAAKRRMKKEELEATGLFSEEELNSILEGSSNPFQVHFDKDGKEYTSKGSKEENEKRAKNIAANRKKGPMKYDPYKGTDGRD